MERLSRAEKRLQKQQKRQEQKQNKYCLELKTITPITLIAKARALLARKILTTPAIRIPINPTMRKVPIFVRSRLVV
mgnify:CR=1 FL=1